MPDNALDADAYVAFRDELFANGLLIDSGVDGVYGRSSVYEGVVNGLRDLISRTMVEPGTESFHVPPVLPRWIFDRTDYLRSFPDLMGSVHTFRGSDRGHADLVHLVESEGDWPSALTPAEVVLCPATCHSLYPLCTGRLPAGGRRFEVFGYCFRCEPSVDPTRMQAFRMQETVYVGDGDGSEAHRQKGLDRGQELLAGLGLDVNRVVANDPFFGKMGTMLAANQLDEALKIEVVTPICSVDRPTAIMSANCHRDHFGSTFSIESSDGQVAHSACVAFGVDRVALALLHTHGFSPDGWPIALRSKLWP